MRNSFRPYRLASLRFKGEAQTLARAGEAGGADGLGDKAAIGAGRRLETEGSEGRLREAGRPARRQVSGRAGVRAPIVALKPGNAGGSQGVQEDGDAMSRHRKRPTVLPARGSHGTACASRHPDVGEADREHPEPGRRTVGVDSAAGGGPRYRGQRGRGVPAHIRWSAAVFAAHGLLACGTPLRRSAIPLGGEPST
jgi:hypothetical protein